MKKKFILLSLMLAAVFTASATITKTIGTGGTYDYASLYEACDSLNQHQLTEDMVWKICTDLTETVNAGIVNNTTHSLTITVDAAETRTITYNPASDNVGPSGHIVIGGVPGHNLTTNSGNIGWTAGTTKNVIIDGSFNGDGNQYLTVNGGVNAGVVLVFYGNVTNTTVKNCRFINTRVISNNKNINYTVILRTEKNTDNHPDGVVLDNCYLESTKHTAMNQTVYFNSSQKSTDAGLVANTTLKNCEIVSKLRGVFFNGALNANFEGCTFRMQSTAGGYLAHGIMGNVNSGVINVKGCKFLELKTNNASAGEYGICGITASGGSTVWNIENNIFTGLDALASGAGSIAITLRAVRCGDPCVVRHNTFVMPTLTNHPSTELLSASPISLLYVAGSTYTVENNIFISHETAANHSLIRGALNANCKHNVFYHDGGNAAIVAGAAVYTDYASLPASAESKWKAVTFNADMSLAEASIGDFDLAVAKLNDITTDINGEDRHDPTYAGAEAPGYLVGQVYEFNTQMGDWDLTQGSAMTKIANNVFRGTYIFGGGDRYITFSQNVSSTASGWDEPGGVNEGRISVLSNGDFVVDGNSAQGTIQMGQGGNSHSFKIPQANGGTFEFTLNFNTMKVDIIKSRVNNLYAFNDASGDWNFGAGTTVTKVSANVFEGEYTLPEDAHLLFATANADNWTDINAAQLHINAGGDYWVNGDSEATLSGDANNSFWIKAAGKYKFNINLNTNKVIITQLNATLDVTDAGYATYYNSTKAYTMPDGMTGYAFNVANGLVEAYTEGQVVPADMPLVLEAPQGNYALEFTTGGTPVDLASQLHGSDAETATSSLVTGSHIFYGLSLAQGNDPATVGFYYMADGGAAFNNGAHKAFLAVPTGSEAPEFLAPAILFNNNGATDIKKVEGQDEVVKFIQDGKLFIQKNGVTYDALGRVVR